LQRDHGWLPQRQARRYVRTYGTRARDLLTGMRGIEDLGQCLGADLYEREAEFLIDTEWARSAEDILWRRTKLGLRLAPAEIENLQRYLGPRSSAKRPSANSA
jgi:glycerol-3-phosphate dehydrogenase